jgi:lactate dehydrogenase-like 2-hydroxyacid dehydrogenase
MSAAPHADVAIPFMQHFDKKFIDAASNLRLIMQFGVGLEGVDVDEATRQGICVSNIPAAETGNAEATAEHALLLSMCLLRRLHNDLPTRFHNQVLGGVPLPRALYKKRVCVVGYGSVGKVLCRYLDVMGAEVTAVRRSPWPEPSQDEPVGMIRSNSLEKVLPDTELLILACELNKSTWHLMDHYHFSLLPDDALVVNVGRGPLVEYHALLDALESKLGGFASDVGTGHPEKPSEPWDPHDIISKHPNTLFTPHCGGYCDYSYKWMAPAVVDAIECVMAGEAPKVWVNGKAK